MRASIPAKDESRRESVIVVTLRPRNLQHSLIVHITRRADAFL
jgi:hypothetical protein